MRCSEAFGIHKGDLVAITGGGGKTTLMTCLARDLAADGLRVIAGTTTKIFPPQDPLARTLLTMEDAAWQERLIGGQADGGYWVLGRSLNDEGKIVGIGKGEADAIFLARLGDVLILEADGAKGKPFKAPRQDEPVIPAAATLVITVIGADSLGLPLTEENFFAWEMISRIAGLPYGGIFTAEMAVRVLLSSMGFQKGVPAGARWIPFINKADAPERRQQAIELAKILRSEGISPVYWGAAGAEVPWLLAAGREGEEMR